MFGKKKKEAPQPEQQQHSSATADGVYTSGRQPNNQPRSYTPPAAHKGQALPGHAGFVTYKVRKKNGMTDLRFNYVRPDGKPDSGPGRYAK